MVTWEWACLKKFYLCKMSLLPTGQCSSENIFLFQWQAARHVSKERAAKSPWAVMLCTNRTAPAAAPCISLSAAPWLWDGRMSPGIFSDVTIGGKGFCPPVKHPRDMQHAACTPLTEVKDVSILSCPKTLLVFSDSVDHKQTPAHTPCPFRRGEYLKFLWNKTQMSVVCKLCQQKTFESYVWMQFQPTGDALMKGVHCC